MLPPVVGDRFATSWATTEIAPGKVGLTERLVAGVRQADRGDDEQENAEQLHDFRKFRSIFVAQ